MKIYHTYAGQYTRYYHEWCLDELDRININKMSKQQLERNRSMLKETNEDWIPEGTRCFACRTDIHGIPHGHFVKDAFAPTFVPEEKQ